MGHPDRGEQAGEAWRALVDGAVRRRWRRISVREGPWVGAGAAPLWPLSQVLHAAVDLLAIGVIGRAELDELVGVLERLRVGAAYEPQPGLPRYYDDNAWVGLALVQAHVVTGDPWFLDRADALMGFLLEGERDGGIYWVERPRRSRHTCSTGPTAELALLLAEHGRRRDELVEVAGRAVAFLDGTLRRSDGLYADHVDDDGAVELTVWSYNQGTPIGADVLRARVTGDRSALAAARSTAEAALGFFARDDRLWRQPPAFNGVFLRNLLLLDAVDPCPAAVAATEAYVDRAQRDARDPTGWFTGGGIGRYERGGALDQAAHVQLLARLALPRDQRVDRW